MGPEDDQFWDDGEHTPCRQEIARLEAELAAAKRNRCDDCGAKVTSYGPSMACPGCGAPNCCQPCCDKANAVDRAEKAEAERDAAVAQVAVLADAVNTLHSGLRTFPVGAEAAARARIERMMAHTTPAIADIPAAATVLLADRDQFKENFQDCHTDIGKVQAEAEQARAERDALREALDSLVDDFEESNPRDFDAYQSWRDATVILHPVTQTGNSL